MPERRAERATRTRIVVALIVPMVAVAAALAAAGIASGATARTATAIPSDGVQPPGGGPTQIDPGPLVPPGATTGGGATSPGGTRTGSPTGSPTPTPTATPTGSPTGTGQASPGAPGVPPGGAGALCASNPSPSGPTTVTVGQAGGKNNVLVDQNGCALYLNINDTNTTSACDATCETSWPPALGPGQAGSGVNAQNLGTFTRQSGKTQVTYFGHQIYYNIGDTAPGQANGQGVNQTWWLVGQNGQPVQN
jgi:predicted lipoprotein with Yx(FWY)xxD motif